MLHVLFCQVPCPLSGTYDKLANWSLISQSHLANVHFVGRSSISWWNKFYNHLGASHKFPCFLKCNAFQKGSGGSERLSNGKYKIARFLGVGSTCVGYY